MVKKFIQMILEAIRQMVGYRKITETIETDDTIISDRMTEKLDSWKNLYQNKPKWVINNLSIKGSNIAKKICELVSLLMINELKIKTVPENYDVESGDEIDSDSFAAFMQKCIDLHLSPKLKGKIERGLAMGGCVIKPYISNGDIYYDFVEQGEFLPIRFDDDGNITDIAFIDQFVSGDYLFTKVERQTYANHQVVVENTAFKSKYNRTNTNNQQLGLPIELTEVSKWADIDPNPPAIEEVDRPLFGYFKVAKENNVDLKSPLGMSFFEPAVEILKKIDLQKARLDWEYEGGQLAIDIDPTSLKYTKKMFGELPQYDERIFRLVDLGENDTYKPYNPQLRDTNYLEGLNAYKMEAEDILGLARGALSRVDGQARTATELRILKQESFDTINSNQEALEDCLQDVIKATYVYANLYSDELGIKSIKPYDVIIDWGDSVLVDRESEAQTKLELVRENILSKAEYRAWYTGEPLEVAAAQIQNIVDTNRNNFINDIMPINNEGDNDNE